MLGEIVSIAVATLWAASAMFFEYAGHKIKAMNLNLIRLVFALVLISLIIVCMSGNPFPKYTNSKVWLWMSLSGFVGFVFGDYFLFSSYRLIPARFTQLIMTLSPAFAAISGYFLLNETLSLKALLGVIITISGIAISIFKKEAHTVHISLPIRGVVFAFLASIGQGVGLVLSKQGMKFFTESIALDASAPTLSTLYVPLAATQIRIITGIVCFTIIIAIMHNFKDLFLSFKEKKSIAAAFGGSIVGPVVGVSLSLLAVELINTAVASTLMALTPLIIIIPDRIINKRKIHLIEVIGAAISVVGVAFFFMK